MRNNETMNGYGMSRAPSNRYGYDVGQNNAYYYEDPEGYVGDYSESDPPSDSLNSPVNAMTQADITELYRRKPQSMQRGNPSARDYQHQQYAPQEYYYEAQMPQVPQHSFVAAAPANRPNIEGPPLYHKRAVSQPQPQRYYNEQQAYRHLMAQPNPLHPAYHSSAQQVTVPRTVPDMQETVPNPVMRPSMHSTRRHPVTVRTPRYVRRNVATSGLYKRPSTLCLPIACQPDPAMYRRPRRGPPPPPQEAYQLPHDVYATPSKHAGRRSSAPSPQHHSNKPKKVESKRELSMTKSRLDAVLERYEKIFGKSVEMTKNSGEQGDVKDNEVYELKPRVPRSVKEKVAANNTEQFVQAITKQQIPEIIKTAETFEVEEISSDVLDELLSELTENGLNDVRADETRRQLSQNAKRAKSPRQQDYPHSPKTMQPDKGEPHLTTNVPHKKSLSPVRTKSKSYNYQEITQSMSKSHHSYASETDECRSHKIDPGTNYCKNLGKTPNTTKSSVIPRVMVDDAMELHRTKSYVVNLIDTALSNHFGTNVCEKNLTKDCMDPRCAMEILKTHSAGKMDKDLSHEIAQILTDSFASNSTAPSGDGSKKSCQSECSCKSSYSGEPNFVKQLKQMRWGHLKHIQREVRRLEDLERFLDSCSIAATFDKYNN